MLSYSLGDTNFVMETLTDGPTHSIVKTTNVFVKIINYEKGIFFGTSCKLLRI